MASQAGVPQRRYVEEDIERGLTMLALCGGNWRRAGERLREQGFDIPPKTLESWKRQTHTQRYEETRARLLPRIQEKIAAEAEDLAIAYAETERQALEAFDLSSLSPKDAAGAIRNLATAKAINVDKAQLMRGNPTQIVEKRDAGEILSKLKSRIGSVDVESEEITDAPALPAVTPE